MGMASYLTNAGYTVLNKLLASQGTLEIVRAQLGSGVCTGEVACRARTSLVSPICDATFAGAKYDGGQAILSVQFQNMGLATGFFVNEIGIYARDPTSGNQILYCYATFDDTPDWIAPASSAWYTRTYDVVTIISNVANVTVTISPSALVSTDDFNVAMENVGNALLLIASENSMVNRQTQKAVQDAVTRADGQADTLDGKIDDTAVAIRGEMATQRMEMTALTDQHDNNQEQAMLAIIALFDPLVRDLRTRLAVAEAQLAALVT